ncbi:MAG TPA: DUF4920 domain-containing protein [Flavobacterium sp.]|jgi:hypothetical protein
MKKYAVLACALLFALACKNNEQEVAPDPVMETPADSSRVDTIASIVPPTEAVEAEEIKEIEIETADEKPVKVEYASFGSKIAADKALTKEQMLAKYRAMKKGDTIAVKFKSLITDVCKKKGCWMKMDLAGEKESFVRFKDYGFFVPLNADQSEAIVSGKAYLDVISVEELKHYAKDGGESQEAIDKITSPKVTYAFQADGVLIQQ